MKPCISQATTMSAAFEADLDAYARGGWRAVELWLTKLEGHLLGRPIGDVRKALDANGLSAPAAAAQGGLLLARGEELATHRDHFRRRLEWLSELGTSTLIVVADAAPRAPSVDHFSRATAALAEAAELAQASGVRIALEFQKSGAICTSLDTAIALVEQCGASNVGVCLDLFHYYNGPSKFEDLVHLTPANLAWIQVSDLGGVPRELAGDADRIFPGEGDYHLQPILDHLGTIGYCGHVSLELFNPHLWQAPAGRVADLGFQALCRSLGRWNEDRPEPWGGP